ncbi:MAG: selenocysteine-specific translation elongation factor [Chloroflexi bacterium]|uniref:Selenocysteine-specific elongation factor n=1 Tax=Candidatus Chlorohelix allophototropha TaxID=3003348 RepID=A0A8T7M2T7_9CHLR|nr:selenocysteine-specific translation elongation factor [Chloroflexota bacterium]WJW66776.1 selenocysteine-specific translation elongation factor [Chloroflexota bacterium L227-S17]
MYVVGTAGHVDHGKSTLVKALTGIDPDRLEEEKRREMTIDLGFAWLKLPSGNEISIVDVPGHERFIKNMLAGVGGFDAALLVIAADEGIMPQTEEHLAILNLLQVERGLVALTKRDMVDEEWLELVTDEVKAKLAGSVLANAPIVPVSARTGQGLKELVAILEEILQNTTLRPDIGKPRLPIDRVFSVTGFGTVVTGTLIEGSLRVGQEVELMPGNLKSRVRGLQMHKTKAEIAAPGNRVAVNLTGLEVSDLQRGMVLTVPGWLHATDLVDVRLHLLPDSPVEITQNSRFDFFSGAVEATAGITILDKEKILPGEEGLLQLRLSEPLALAKNDRFILRLPSPSQTVGGGIVIDPQPRRHKRFQAQVIQTLQTLEKGTPAEVLLQTLNSDSGLPRDLKALSEATKLPSPILQEALEQLVAQNSTLILGDAFYTGLAAWQRIADKSVALLRQFHAQFPLKRGMGREELKSKLAIGSPKIFNLLLARLLSEQVLIESEGKGGGGMALSLPGFAVQFNPAQQKQVDTLLAAFRQNPYSPPSISELGTDLNIVAALVDDGRIKKVSDSLYFINEAYETMVSLILKRLDEQGKITLAEVRDMFGNSRKYVQSLLEHLDEIKLTQRVGDERVRRK